jgi:SAM-dependent methyltransferase
MTDAATHAAPSPWITRFAPLIPPGARVLDLACGQGRHSRFLAARLCDVVAVDRDSQALVALAGVPRVTTIAADLEGGPWPLSGRQFDAIIVANYLHRPLFPKLLDLLDSSGAFLYETFAAGNEAYGRPSNPEHLLAADELLSLLRERLTIVAFEQGLIRPARSAVVQRIAAVGRGRRWPPLLPPLPTEAAAAQDAAAR